MKLSFKLLLATIADIIIISNIFAVESNEEIKSACITYRISGAFQNGTEIVYFKDNKKSIHKTIRIGKDEYNSYSEDTLEINDGDYIYLIDLILKKGNKIKNPTNIIESLPQNEKDEVIKASSDIISRNLSNFNKNHATTIHDKILYFGKMCNVYSTPFSKHYIWNDIIFRREMSAPYQSLKEIVKFEVNIPISDDKFTPPLDITLSESFKLTDAFSSMNSLINFLNTSKNNSEKENQ